MYDFANFSDFRVPVKIPIRSHTTRFNAAINYGFQREWSLIISHKMFVIVEKRLKIVYLYSASLNLLQRPWTMYVWQNFALEDDWSHFDCSMNHFSDGTVVYEIFQSFKFQIIYQNFCFLLFSVVFGSKTVFEFANSIRCDFPEEGSL